MNVEILPEPALYRRAAELFVESGQRALHDHGRFTAALSGGSTPKALYALLAQDYAGSLDWSKTHIFFSDERCVPPDHADSNFRIVQETLLSRIDAPEANVHRMRGEDEPTAAAQSYADELRDIFADGPPGFGLILLGIGEDCHTASIFPQSELMNADGGAVASIYVRSLGVYRLTLTPSTIKNAERVIVLATGHGKAEAVRRAILGPFEPEQCPAQILREANGEVVWLVDGEAGVWA